MLHPNSVHCVVSGPVGSHRDWKYISSNFIALRPGGWAPYALYIGRNNRCLCLSLTPVSRIHHMHVYNLPNALWFVSKLNTKCTYNNNSNKRKKRKKKMRSTVDSVVVCSPLYGRIRRWYRYIWLQVMEYIRRVRIAGALLCYYICHIVFMFASSDRLVMIPNGNS